MIAQAVQDAVAAKRYNARASSNRPSELGHSCLRYLAHLRRDKKPDTPIGLQEIFEEGNYQERTVKLLLDQAGFNLEQTQTSFQWPEFQIHGRIDGTLSYVGKRPDWWPTEKKEVLCEIKTISPYGYKAVNTIEDIRNSRTHWMRKWYDQIQIYLLLHGDEMGVLILKDKTAARIKDIWVPLDYDHADTLLNKAREINEHMERGTWPERTEGSQCRQCPFMIPCSPTITSGEGAQFIESPELEEAMQRYVELKSLVSEYNAVKKYIDEELGETEHAVVGDYYVDAKWIERKGFTVAPQRILRRKIEKLIGGDDDEGLGV